MLGSGTVELFDAVLMWLLDASSISSTYLLPLLIHWSRSRDDFDLMPESALHLFSTVIVFTRAVIGMEVSSVCLRTDDQCDCA